MMPSSSEPQAPEGPSVNHEKSELWLVLEQAGAAINALNDEAIGSGGAHTQQPSPSASAAALDDHHFQKTDSLQGAPAAAGGFQQQDFQLQTSTHDFQGLNTPTPVQQPKHRPTQVRVGAKNKFRGLCESCTATEVKCDGLKPSCTCGQKKGKRRRSGPKALSEPSLEPQQPIAKRLRLRPAPSAASAPVASFDQFMHTDCTLTSFNTHAHASNEVHAQTQDLCGCDLCTCMCMHTSTHTHAHTHPVETSPCVWDFEEPALALCGGSEDGLQRVAYLSRQPGSFDFGKINDELTDLYLQP